MTQLCRSLSPGCPSLDPGSVTDLRVGALASHQVVSLSPAGHAAGPAWSRPRAMHWMGLSSPLGFPRPGLGRGPYPEGVSQLWVP